MNKHNKNKGLDAEILGLNNPNIDSSVFEKPVHSDVIPSLTKLKFQASAAGFDLQLASGFRDFDRQLAIWNAKARGLRPILDKDERPIDFLSLNLKERMFSILRWSALPGTSRHHWGSDFDIYDASAINSDYQLQLTVAETEKGGPFEKFYGWLNESGVLEELNFVRPYSKYSGGVAPEPWHLSYSPLAKNYADRMSIDLISMQIQSADIELKDQILENLEEIYQRFIILTC